MLKEFKEFAIRGNMIDMAVGVIIGGAIGKIVSSIVNDLIMPVVGHLIAGMNFTDLKVVLSPAIMEGETVIKPEAAIMYGSFIQNIIDFIIIAVFVFLIVKMINKLRDMGKKDEPEAEEETPEDIALLTEIRDLLKEQQGKG